MWAQWPPRSPPYHVALQRPRTRHERACALPLTPLCLEHVFAPPHFMATCAVPQGPLARDDGSIHLQKLSPQGQFD